MTVTIRIGDCREVLRTLADESVHCVVTSPPYWGLRDYGTARWEGGSGECSHMLPSRGDAIWATRKSTLGGSTDSQGHLQEASYRTVCGRCGAHRVDDQIGLESGYAEYVAAMVGIFAEVRRVLRSDGTCWVNLGDSYAGGGRGGNPEESLYRKQATNVGSVTGVTKNKWPMPDGLKSKDLVGIPWRVAFALQADGWYLRQDIIWSKPNPMPESVRDRCTKAHEYIFLLSKSERYWYDQKAIAEVATPGTHVTTEKSFGTQAAGAKSVPTGNQVPGKEWAWGDTRNKRSVWEVTAAPFPDAHFATFPPALIEPCVKAGCPEKCCARCGAPWTRQIEIESRANAPSCNGKYDGIGKHRTISGGVSNDARKRIDLGVSPACDCYEYGHLPGIVLDPFGGAGTTGLVADRLGRNAVLIELNPEYAAMAERRLRGDAGMFAEVELAYGHART